MKFLENLWRYPRFFISSMIGLILILLNPIIKLSRQVTNQKIILFCFFLCVLGTFWILNKMINPDL